MKVLAAALVKVVLNPVRADIGVQVARMRLDMRECGHSHVGCEELRLLCHSEVSPEQELKGIAQIAEWEHWTFEYQPDGSVLFTALLGAALSRS